MSMEKKPVIGIFRHTLLPPSETFIAEQATNISDYQVHYFGREKVAGHFDLQNCHTIQSLSEKRFLERAWYTLTGNNRKLLREMKSVSPHLLHAHFGVDGIYALAFAKKLRIPLITTFHGYDATISLKELIISGKISWLRYALKLEELKHRGDLFIAVSAFIRNRLVDRGFPPDKIFVHYIGIDPEKFDTVGCNDDGKKILTVGRLVEKKGTEYLIRAIAIIKNEISDVCLEIVGDGPLQSSLEKLARELGISNQVNFRGTISHDDVSSAMKRASVFCLPSITAKDGDAEGMGLVLLEAAASMKPVVGTLHGGIPEAVRDDENGFLVPEREVGTLASRLTLLLKNRELRQKMGLVGRKMVEKEFNIKKQTKKLEQIYSKYI